MNRDPQEFHRYRKIIYTHRVTDAHETRRTTRERLPALTCLFITAAVKSTPAIPEGPDTTQLRRSGLTLAEQFPTPEKQPKAKETP